MEPVTYYNSPIALLPLEIHGHIQTYLDRNWAASYAGVCRAFNQMLTENNDVWKAIFPEITFPEGINAKQYLNEHAVGSFDQVLKRLQQFARHTFAEQQQNQLTFLFPYNPNYTLTVKVNFFAKEEEMTECENTTCCLFLQKITSAGPVVSDTLTAFTALNREPYLKPNYTQYRLEAKACLPESDFLNLGEATSGMLFYESLSHLSSLDPIDSTNITLELREEKETADSAKA